MPMKKHFADPLAEFNQLYKKMDGIYHSYAKALGISDMTLWLLYSLCEDNSSFTQKELCSAWCYPVQTVNSALKNLEKQEIIALEHIPGNLKNKKIVLTEKGKEYTQKIIAPLIAAEQKSLQFLTEEEQEVLLSLIRKYTELLQIKVNEI